MGRGGACFFVFFLFFTCIIQQCQPARQREHAPQLTHLVMRSEDNQLHMAQHAQRRPAQASNAAMGAERGEARFGQCTKQTVQQLIAAIAGCAAGEQTMQKALHSSTAVQPGLPHALT
jgi:hypothetical protein